MPVALSVAVSGPKINPPAIGKTKISLINKIQAKPVLISIVLIILLITAASLYLTQINILATKGYQINEFKQNLARLQEKNKVLELQVAESQSRQVIFQRVEELGMVKVAQVDYLSPSGSSVAVR